MSAAWFTPAELAALGLPDLPDERAIRIRAEAEWRHPDRAGTHWRKRAGRGGGYEYHLAVLPRAAQIKLAMAAAAPAADPRAGMTRADAWAWFDRLPEKKRAVARERLALLDAAEVLVRAGTETVVAMHHVARHGGTAISTLYRWREAVYGLDRGDWLPALAPRHAGRQATVDCSPEAWETLKADYLRPEQPNFVDCYRRAVAIAAKSGWTLPSQSTLQRRMEALPVEVRTLAREGVDALKVMFPAQERARGHFHALEAVNADGHKWDVFVRWPDGWVGRPQMVAIQDLYSGTMLAWRVDKTANAAAVRLAIGDVVESYGIFRLCYLDNGRDFASKWITGGTPNRYRFKVLEDEPSGLLTQLGVEVHWTTPYSGQSKPIERAFRDFAQGLAKHPRFAGAYVGNKPDAKPENYGSAAVPLDVFLATLAEGIAEHNARLGRRTAVCAGRLSFEQAFAVSYARAPITKATAEQRRLWLLAAEAIRVDPRDGAITLEGNRFWAEELVSYRGQRVTVRFDPQALQEPLHVYRSDGGYVCTAQCVAAAGFNDVDAAREHSRQRKSWMKARRAMLDAECSMTIQDVAALLPAADLPAPLPQTQVIRPLIVRGGAAVARQPVEAPDDLAWLVEANRERRSQAPLRLVDDWREEVGGDD